MYRQFCGIGPETLLLARLAKGGPFLVQGSAPCACGRESRRARRPLVRLRLGPGQRVLASGLDDPLCDGQPEQGERHVPGVVPADERLRDGGLGARHAVGEQREDVRRDALDRGRPARRTRRGRRAWRATCGSGGEGSVLARTWARRGTVSRGGKAASTDPAPSVAIGRI